MGDNKISEAVARLERAWVAGMDEEYRDDLRAVLDHLQGEAVPVAVAAGISEFGVLECNLLPGGLEQLQSTGGDAKLYLHPQPAELSEVSGNSGELTVDTVEILGRTYLRSDVERALAAIQPVGLSPIATRKLGELAAQGYVTNGVAIFNPATGKRGLVDNLGYVGWQGAQSVDLGQFIALAKFGEEFAFSAEKQPHSRVVYSQASRLLALIDGRDAGTGDA